MGERLNSLIGKFVKDVYYDFNEVTLWFNDGSKVTFNAEGHEGTRMEVELSVLVTEKFNLG